MINFTGTFADYNRHIGPRIRNVIQTNTRPYKPSACQHCCKENVTLDAAHVHGKDRKQIIKTVLDQYKQGDLYEIDLDRVEKEILDAHNPIPATVLFLCRQCHTEYDSDSTLDWTAVVPYNYVTSPATKLLRAERSPSPAPISKQGKSDDYGKAIRRLPGWANNPQQANHRIIRGFLLVAKTNERVTYDSLRRQCTDLNSPRTYVDPSKFYGHFQSMKTDGGNSHGKFFIESAGRISIWDEVLPRFNELKNKFE